VSGNGTDGNYISNHYEFLLEAPRLIPHTNDAFIAEEYQ